MISLHIVNESSFKRRGDGPVTFPQYYQYHIWVLIDPGLSANDNFFSSIQSHVHPNEDASLALASCMAGKEQ